MYTIDQQDRLITGFLPSKSDISFLSMECQQAYYFNIMTSIRLVLNQTIKLTCLVLCLSRTNCSLNLHLYYVSLLSQFRVVMFFTISIYKRRSVHLYLQLFVGRRMSYLRYLCLFTHSFVQHILCCVFVLFFLRLVYRVLPVSLDCPFFLPFRYSLTFLYQAAVYYR